MFSKSRFALIVLALIAALFVVSLPSTSAQSGGTIAYGETVEGEITNAEFEIPYTFTGASGDAIVIILAPVDEFGDFDTPAVLLLDSNNSLLGSVESYFGAAIFVGVLPADGDYTILASRLDGRSGDAVGAFTLTLLQPEVLGVGDSASGSVTNEDTVYYIVRDLTTFSLTYERTAGDFNPEVKVSSIEEGTLTEVALLNGDYLVGGSINIAVEDSLVTPVFVVTLGEALFDFNFDPVSADYTLTVGE